MDEIKINDTIMEEIYRLNSQLIEGKVRFADLQIKYDNLDDILFELRGELSKIEKNIEDKIKQLDSIDEQKNQIKNIIESLSKTFQNRLNEIGSQYGIESNENQKWTFDISNGKFIKSQG